MLSDDPAKGLGRATEESLLWSRLKVLMGAPSSELHLVSPYLVPGPVGSGHFAVLAQRGVKVTVLTNSLEATDVVAVHAGYAKYRKSMLESGVRLFEMKRQSPSSRRRALTGRSGSSHSSLHAKTFAIDRSRFFVGSFNFDPRSARLNTELGFVIDSPTLAGQLADAFAGGIPERAYGVRLNAERRLEWTESRDGRDMVLEREPGAGVGLRFAVAAFSVLPIEWLL